HQTGVLLMNLYGVKDSIALPCPFIILKNG
ncbi:unnamed protein product, partial [marine sediment metagenome]